MNAINTSHMKFITEMKGWGGLLHFSTMNSISVPRHCSVILHRPSSAHKRKKRLPSGTYFGCHVLSDTQVKYAVK